MPFEIIRPGTRYDIVGKWRICVTLSLLLIAASLAAIPVLGFRLGIDFAGGTEMQLRFTGGAVEEEKIRQVALESGAEGASVVRYGSADSNEYLLRFKQVEVEEAEDKGELVDAIEAAIDEKVAPVELDRVEFVGPRVGAELRRDGLKALAYACLFILAYIAFRFSLRFAPGAVLALVHDVLITAGIFVLLGMEFDLRVLAALLAIIGYSLNDTIIVYDRIRENLELRTKADLPEVLNLSVNQTLSRTILTSGTTMLAVLALLFLGGEAIRPFALAMAIGILVGTYSSIYIAGPVLMAMEGFFADEPKKGNKRSHARA